MRKAFGALAAAWPGVPAQVGEYGFPEEEAPGTADIDAMIRVVDEEAAAAGVKLCWYWQTFDNEQGAGGVGTRRGYWLRNDAGALTTAGTTLQSLGPG